MNETRTSVSLRQPEAGARGLSTQTLRDPQPQTGTSRLLDKKQKMFELQEALDNEKTSLLTKVYAQISWSRSQS